MRDTVLDRPADSGASPCPLCRLPFGWSDYLTRNRHSIPLIPIIAYHVSLTPFPYFTFLFTTVPATATNCATPVTTTYNGTIILPSGLAVSYAHSMDGLFDDVIVANRNLTRTFTYLETLEDGTEGDPITLAAYTRLIYNLQTGDSVPIEILTVDTDSGLHPEYADWLTITAPATLGEIVMDIPGSALVWTPSDSGKWQHELVLLGADGGILQFFTGSVLYKKPTVIIAP